MEKITRLVFICTGNVCRSPMAWGIARREAEKRRLRLIIDSAGTGAAEDMPPSENALTACAEIGIDISDHRSKRTSHDLFTPETLFVVMTQTHADWLFAVDSIPYENTAVLGKGIPDPYGRSLDVYRQTRDAIDNALTGLFDLIEPLAERLPEDDSFEDTTSTNSAANSSVSGLTTAPAVVLRRAQTGDLDAITAIEELCFADPWQKEGFAEELRSELADFVCAEYDGRVIGYGLIITVAGISELPKICVSPDCRRIGAGRAMLGWLEDAAAARGSDELTLEVRISNLPAQSLYSAHGFERIGVRPGFYRSPTEDAVIMTKPLSDGQ